MDDYDDLLKGTDTSGKEDQPTPQEASLHGVRDHAAHVAAYYTNLVELGVPGQYAMALTVEFVRNGYAIGRGH